MASSVQIIRSLIAVLEDWIITDNGREPKTWPTFIEVLRELDQDLSISVGSEICASLEREGVLSYSKLLFIVRSYVRTYFVFNKLYHLLHFTLLCNLLDGL